MLRYRNLCGVASCSLSNVVLPEADLQAAEIPKFRAQLLNPITVEDRDWQPTADPVPKSKDKGAPGTQNIATLGSLGMFPIKKIVGKVEMPLNKYGGVNHVPVIRHQEF